MELSPFAQELTPRAQNSVQFRGSGLAAGVADARPSCKTPLRTRSHCRPRGSDAIAAPTARLLVKSQLKSASSATGSIAAGSRSVARAEAGRARPGSGKTGLAVSSAARRQTCTAARPPPVMCRTSSPKSPSVLTCQTVRCHRAARFRRHAAAARSTMTAAPAAGTSSGSHDGIGRISSLAIAVLRRVV